MTDFRADFEPPRLPLWERIVCAVLDACTRVVDAFTGWMRR